DARRARAATAGRELATERIGADLRRPRGANAHGISAVPVRRQDRMRAIGRSRGELVTERATHATAPRRVGEYIDRRSGRPFGAVPACMLEVARAHRLDLVEQRLEFDEPEWIRPLVQSAVQRSRMDEQIGFAVAVRVVPDAFAELPKRLDPRCVELERAGEPLAKLGEIVAERRNDRPDPLPPR